MSAPGIVSKYVLYGIFLPLGWDPLSAVQAPLVSWYQTEKDCRKLLRQGKFHSYDANIILPIMIETQIANYKLQFSSFYVKLLRFCH